MNTASLNTGQKAAAEAFFEFLLEPEQKGFIISGAAGVGKTFLMHYIINETMQHYVQSCKLMGMDPLYEDIHMTATTNKAAEVLGGSVGRDTSTIHSFLGLSVFPDFNTGKTVLKRIPNRFHVRSKEIIFIDECSMIDSDLFKILMEATERCKVVFVGDKNQLSPVFEKISPVYLQNFPEFELTEQMRNSGQPHLMTVCQQLRETVQSGIFKPLPVDHDAIRVLLNHNIQPTLLDAFVPGPNLDCRILAYTNKQVNDFNAFIRAERKLPALYTPGEILVNNTACKLSRDQTLSVEQEVTVISDDGVTWVNLGKDDEGKNIEIEVQTLTLKGRFGEYFYNVKCPTDRAHADSLIKWFGKKKDYQRKFNLQEKFADLRPRDAATVHKSQGSTYDSVFIDLDNISKVTQPDVAARMLYVAFSRAKHHVYLYGKLAERFGGLSL